MVAYFCEGYARPTNLPYLTSYGSLNRVCTHLTKVYLLAVDPTKLIAPLLDHLSLMTLWVLTSCTDPLSDHALKLSHPAPFHPMHTNGERVSENEKGFALGVLVFEVM